MPQGWTEKQKGLAALTPPHDEITDSDVKAMNKYKKNRKSKYKKKEK